MVRFIIRIRSIIIYIILLRWIICTLKGNSITIIILGHMILIFHFNHITGYTGYTSVDHIALVFVCGGGCVYNLPLWRSRGRIKGGYDLGGEGGG